MSKNLQKRKRKNLVKKKGEIFFFTSSSISFVCDAERQKRTRPSTNGVAGNPTVTTATPRFNISRLNALKQKRNTHF